MTIAQDWARKRNMTKGRIAGMITLCNQMCESGVLIPDEKECIQMVEVQLRHALTAWNLNNKYSKKQYLKEKGDKNG